jgi:hypothetical protein
MVILLLEKAPVKTETAQGQETAYAAADYADSDAKAESGFDGQALEQKLPQTASNLPALGALGVLLLLASGATGMALKRLT